MRRSTIGVPPALVVVTVIALAAVILMLPLRLHGQVGGPQAVFLAIPEVYPDLEARAVLLREPGKDIILLRVEDATPEVLAMSLATLRRVRRDTPRPERGEMIPIVNFVITRDMTDEYRARMEAALTRLNEQPRRRVGNLGSGRWLRYHRE